MKAFCKSLKNFLDNPHIFADWNRKEMVDESEILDHSFRVKTRTSEVLPYDWEYLSFILLQDEWVPHEGPPIVDIVIVSNLLNTFAVGLHKGVYQGEACLLEGHCFLLDDCESKTYQY